MVHVDEDRCIKSTKLLKVNGANEIEHPRKKWDDIMKADLQTSDLMEEMTKDWDDRQCAVPEKTSLSCYN